MRYDAAAVAKELSRVLPAYMLRDPSLTPMEKHVGNMPGLLELLPSIARASVVQPLDRDPTL